MVFSFKNLTCQIQNKTEHLFGVSASYGINFKDDIFGWDTKNGTNNFGTELSYTRIKNKLGLSVGVSYFSQEFDYSFTEYYAPWANKLRRCKADFIGLNLKINSKIWASKNRSIYLSNGLTHNRPISAKYKIERFNGVKEERKYETDTLGSQFGLVNGIMFQYQNGRLSLITSLMCHSMLKTISDLDDGRVNFMYSPRISIVPSIGIAYQLKGNENEE